MLHLHLAPPGGTIKLHWELYLLQEGCGQWEPPPEKLKPAATGVTASAIEDTAAGQPTTMTFTPTVYPALQNQAV